MFANRSDERSWSELSKREIIIKTLVIWVIATVFVVTAIVNGFQYFDMGLAGFALIMGVSISRDAISELTRRRKQQETNSDDNDDNVGNSDRLQSHGV